MVISIPLVSGVLGKIKSFQKEKIYETFVSTRHRLHPLEEDAPIVPFVHILSMPTIIYPSVASMGHTPYARYLYLSFDSGVSYGLR